MKAGSKILRKRYKKRKYKHRAVSKGSSELLQDCLNAIRTCRLHRLNRAHIVESELRCDHMVRVGWLHERCEHTHPMRDGLGSLFVSPVVRVTHAPRPTVSHVAMRISQKH